MGPIVLQLQDRSQNLILLLNKSSKMRISTYTTAILIENKHTLFYNSLSGKFVVVKNYLLNTELLSIQDLLNRQKELFVNLCNSGVLIEDDYDEISEVRKRIELAENNCNELIIHINPTLDCNFSCWYCYEKHVPNSFMTESVISSVIKYISNTISNNKIKRVELGFFGGEPLLYFKKIILPILSTVNMLCEKDNINLSVNFTSNGYLINNTIINYLSNYSCGFQITLDGYKDFHDRTRFHKPNKGSYDKIVKNIISLASHSIDVIVRINYTSENYESITRISQNFIGLPASCKKYIKFDLQRVWQDTIEKFDKTYNGVKDIRKLFRDSGFIVLDNYLLHDVRYPCYGDKINYVLINYDGNVFGCTARDFTKANSIGRITEDGVIEYNNVFNLRNSLKFSKETCLKCRIAPICGGGCKQIAYEARNIDKCIYNYTSKDKDSIVIDLFERYVLNI